MTGASSFLGWKWGPCPANAQSLNLIGTPKLWDGDPKGTHFVLGNRDPIGTPGSQKNWHSLREWSQNTENRDPKCQKGPYRPIGTHLETVQRGTHLASCHLVINPDLKEENFGRKGAAMLALTQGSRIGCSSKRLSSPFLDIWCDWVSGAHKKTVKQLKQLKRHWKCIKNAIFSLFTMK